MPDLKILNFPERNDTHSLVESGKIVLEEAIKMGLHSVVVLGVDSSGQLCIANSENRNFLEIMGAIETAKHHLYNAD